MRLGHAADASLPRVFLVRKCQLPHLRRQSFLPNTNVACRRAFGVVLFTPAPCRLHGSERTLDAISFVRYCLRVRMDPSGSGCLARSSLDARTPSQHNTLACASRNHSGLNPRLAERRLREGSANTVNIRSRPRARTSIRSREAAPFNARPPRGISRQPQVFPTSAVSPRRLAACLRCLLSCAKSHLRENSLTRVCPSPPPHQRCDELSPSDRWCSGPWWAFLSQVVRVTPGLTSLCATSNAPSQVTAPLFHRCARRRSTPHPLPTFLLPSSSFLFKVRPWGVVVGPLNAGLERSPLEVRLRLGTSLPRSEGLRHRNCGRT
jgi:hypothetical protein